MSDKHEQDQEFEQALLGSLLIANPDNLPRLSIQAHCFSNRDNGLIFQTFFKQLKNRVKPDIVTLTNDPDLAGVQKWYIAGLTNKVPSDANLAFYEGEILKAWQTRTAKSANERFKTRIEAADYTGEIEPAIREYIGILSGALCDKHNGSHIVTYEEYRRRRKDRKYWEEFAPALFDRLPFPDGSINLIGARSGAGKTNALINIMRELLETAAPDTVINNKHREQLKNATRRMVFVSLEMIADDILDRLALSLSWTIRDRFTCLDTLKENPFFNMQRFHTSQNYPDTPPEDSFKAYSFVLENIIDPAMQSGRLVVLDEIEAVTLEEILLDLARVHIGPGDIVLIDYIQLLPAATNEEAERYATADHLRIRYIVYELRKAAKKSGAIFICAAQLNREAAREQAEGKINIETAFKDSADLEQAAHSAIIINRKDGNGREPPVLSFHVVKARSSHHLGLHRNIVWKSGFYHMELEEEKEEKHKKGAGNDPQRGNNPGHSKTSNATGNLLGRG
jgi:replicative DNA helicase